MERTFSDINESDVDDNVLINDIVDDKTSSEDGEELDIFKRKKRKRGRRSVWSDAVVDDLVDIVASNEIYKKKLLYENTKKISNTLLYEGILETIKGRADERGEICTFTVEQLRNKFKSCVCWCKKAALTVKTATGIARFRDDKRLGSWFEQLYPLIKARDSCQPEQGIEPSAVHLACDNAGIDDTAVTPTTYVPSKSKKIKQRDVLADAVKAFNRLAEKDDTTQILNFMREENEKNRQAQLEMFRIESNNFLQMMNMMTQSSQSSQIPPRQQQHPYSHYHPTRTLFPGQSSSQQSQSPPQGFYPPPNSNRYQQQSSTSTNKPEDTMYNRSFQDL